MTAPVSLAHQAEQRELTAEQEVFLARCRLLEDEIRHLIKAVELARQFDSVWLTHARSYLQLGVSCLRSSIARRPFF